MCFHTVQHALEVSKVIKPSYGFGLNVLFISDYMVKILSIVKQAFPQLPCLSDYFF